MKSFAYKLFFLLLTVLPFNVFAQTDILHLESNVVDTIFGQAVADPYRWMEDLGSDSVKKWLKAQDKMTTSQTNKFLERFSNASSSLANHWGLIYPDANKQGPWYFHLKYTRGATGPEAILYYRKKLFAHSDVAFDPNVYNNKLIYNIAGYWLSDNSRYLAVAVSASGSDWRDIYVRDLSTNKTLEDKLSWIKFSTVVWWQNGFFYARYPEPTGKSGNMTALTGQQMYYHKLGDTQDKDELIMALPDNINDVLHFEKTSNSRYLVLTMSQKIKGQWYTMLTCKDLADGLYADWNVLASSPDSENVGYKMIDVIDSSFYFLTNYKAPHYRVLKTDANQPGNFTEVIPETEKVILSVHHLHQQLVALCVNHGIYNVDMFTYNGKKTHTIAFDTGMAVHGFEGSPDDSETLYTQNSFYYPQVVYNYNFNTRTSEIVDKTIVRFEPGYYTTKLVFYTSKDGTRVPMYLTYKKGIKLTGSNPVLLYGYGGFGWPMSPFFNLSNIVLFENDGILAVPLIRGGGEMGVKWHDDGRLLNKQNSFDDFAAAAEYLIKENYTKKQRLAIMGGSNGGLLMGVMLTQHPDLFQVAVSEMGAFDMVRFDKFTGGRYWTNEYGSPKNPVEFKNLYSYSPLHHVKAGTDYPATLFITGAHDDRVPSFHTYKFLAALQEKSAGNHPHLLFAEESSGHGGSLTYTSANTEQSVILAFIFGEMNLPLDPF